MKTELFISWRYLVTKRKEKFISLISVISILGVAIGVAALIVVTAVMTGFDQDLREKIVGNYAHITLVGFGPMDYTQGVELMDKTVRLVGTEQALGDPRLIADHEDAVRALRREAVHHARQRLHSARTVAGKFVLGDCQQRATEIKEPCLVGFSFHCWVTC